MRRFISTCLAALVLVGGGCRVAHAQRPTASIGDYITTAPLQLKLKDLDGTWRRVSVAGPLELGQILRNVSSLLFGGQGVYYTRGTTVSLGGETYLVAYQPRMQGLDLVALVMRQASENGTPPPGGMPLPPKMTPDTVLSLSLLNLHTIGSLEDIRPFEMQEELAGSAVPGMLEASFEQAHQQALRVSSLSNLKQLGLATIMYTQDYDEKFPPMGSAATWKKAIMPYVKAEAVFVHPGTKQPYLPNPSLSKVSEASIEDPANTVVAYEASPMKANGKLTRGVLFADGHAKDISEDEWPALKRKSKIP